MKKAFKLIICILVISLMFSSCEKTSKRINDLTIVQALAVDGGEKGTKVSLQYLNLFSNSSAEELKGNVTAVTKGEGKNISDAVFSTSKNVSNDIFFGQNKLIIFGFDWAQNSIDEGINYLLKSKDSRPDVLAAIGIPSGEEIVKSKENSAQIPAENIFSLIKLGETNGHAPAVTVADILNLYNDDTSDIYFPILGAEKDNVKCVGTAIFSLDKCAATLSEEETVGFLIVKDRFKSGVISFNTKELGRVSAQINSLRVKKSVEIKNNKLLLRIRIRNKLTVNETEKTIKNPLTEGENKSIEKLCEKKLKSLCENSVKKCFENKSDPFMTARYLYLRDIGLYNSLKDNWRDKLSDIEVEAEVSSSLQRISNNTAK